MEFRASIPRRAVLGGGAVLAAAAVLLGAPVAHTPAPRRPADLRDRWTEILTAGSTLEYGDTTVRNQLSAMDEQLGIFSRLMDKNDAQGAVFDGVPLGPAHDPGNLTVTASRLQTMARAWATPGSRWQNDGDVLERIDTGLGQLLEAGYRAGAAAYGAWFQWEIGTPRPLADIACVLREVLPKDRVTDVLDAIDHFIPDPRESWLNSYPSTGANRMNTARAALVSALVRQDEARARECVAAIEESWTEPIRRDGFYPDGGFIQHVNVAYNGSYGVEWLRDVGPVLLLLSQSELEVAETSPVWRRVDETFFPIMVRGHVTDAFRGRAVSRVTRGGTDVGRTVLGAIAQLAEIAPDHARSRWMALMSRWNTEASGEELLAGTDVPTAVALAPARAANPAAGEAEPASRYFSSIDRLVHRGEGWSAVLALSSRRIAAFEASGTENVLGGRTGNRMRYVYVGNDPSVFDEDYWATIDYAHPPGATTHEVELRQDLANSDGTRVPENEWAGGFVLGGLSATGFHQVGLGSDAPHCRTLTVALTDRIVELVSDVQSSHLPARTMIEHRPVADGQSLSVSLNGISRDSFVSTRSARWAHFAGMGGYVFLTRAPVRAEYETRSGSHTEVLAPSAEPAEDDRVERTWATMSLTHRAGQDGEAWILLPGATVERTASIAEAPAQGTTGVVVEQNDAKAQVVTIGGSTTVAAVWSELTLTTDSGLSVQVGEPMMLGVRENEDGTLLLRVAEPTQKRAAVSILVAQEWGLEKVGGALESDVVLENAGSTTKCSVTTSGLEGRAISITLHRR